MHDTLIPEERILAIQEAFSGFIVREVLDTAGEFYCDGVSNIDNFSCTLYVIDFCVALYMSKWIYIYIIAVHTPLKFQYKIQSEMK